MPLRNPPTMRKMPFRRVPAVLLLLCLMTPALTSCLVRRRSITRRGAGAAKNPALLVANRETLVNEVARQYNAVHDFSATVDMVPALGTAEKSKITEYKDVRAYILYRRPSDIRIVGLYPVVRNTAFDMVSTGLDFRLYDPEGLLCREKTWALLAPWCRRIRQA